MEDEKKNSKKEKKSESNLRILKELRYFVKNSDKDHPLTTDALEELVKSWELAGSDRHTITKDIKLLNEEFCKDGFGTIINDARDKEKRNAQHKYYLARMDSPESIFFSNRQLQLLIDAVSTSRVIKYKDWSELTQKMKHYTSDDYWNRMMRSQVLFTQHGDDDKSSNSHMLKLIERLNDAIEHKQSVAFDYYEYYLGPNKNCLRQGYEMSPYALLLSDGFYYLVGWDNKKGKMAYPRRVDRIKYKDPKDLRVFTRNPKTKSSITWKAEPPTGFNSDRYSTDVFQMFPSDAYNESLSENERNGVNKVELECRNGMVKYVYDKFPFIKEEEYKPSNNYDGEFHKDTVFTVEVPVQPEAPFYSWVAGFGGDIRIVGPQKAKEMYVTFLEKALLGQTENEIWDNGGNEPLETRVNLGFKNSGESYVKEKLESIFPNGEVKDLNEKGQIVLDDVAVNRFLFSFLSRYPDEIYIATQSIRSEYIKFLQEGLKNASGSDEQRIVQAEPSAEPEYEK